MALASARTVAVGQAGARRREDELCVGDHSRVDQIRGNLVARKCRAREGVTDCRRLKRIVDRKLMVVGFIAGQFRVGGHQEEVILGLEYR